VGQNQREEEEGWGDRTRRSGADVCRFSGETDWIVCSSRTIKKGVEVGSGREARAQQRVGIGGETGNDAARTDDAV
jgi:hypothetical protein